MRDARQTVEELFAALHALDFERYYSLMADDIDYRMEKLQLRGVDAVRKSMARLGKFTRMDAEIITFLVEGDTVMTERIDHVEIAGKRASLPVAGTLIVRDGKIAVWRDYFDWQTWVKQLGLAE